MNGEWRFDFSYDYFRTILRATKVGFQCRLIREAPDVLGQNCVNRTVFLRHDVDLDPNRALKMAEIEAELGVCSTYMLMVTAPLYRVEDARVGCAIRRLISFGHEVALHFDPSAYQQIGQNHPTPASLEACIDSECTRLEVVSNSPVRSISFHRPSPHYLRGPLLVAGRVNAYSRELMGWYLSDSKGSWRAGEPVPKLLKPDGTILQLLIHPIWWGDKHMSAEDRLQLFYEDATQGYPPEQIQAFDAALSAHLGVRRRGSRDKKGKKIA